jgi:transposase
MRLADAAADFPPWKMVDDYFRPWQRQGRWH